MVQVYSCTIIQFSSRASKHRRPLLPFLQDNVSNVVLQADFEFVRLGKAWNPARKGRNHRQTIDKCYHLLIKIIAYEIKISDEAA